MERLANMFCPFLTEIPLVSGLFRKP